MADQPPFLEVRDLRLTFGDRRILAGVDLAVTRGAVVSVFGKSGTGKSVFLKCLAGLLIPESGGDMSWRIGDHGFRMTLSARVPDLVATRLGDWLRGWLGNNGLDLDDVASWAVHPGGPRILGAVERAAGLTPDQTRVSRGVLAEFGNMSSATVLFTLDRLRSEGAPGPCVALALGPGLVAEATLIV